MIDTENNISSRLIIFLQNLRIKKLILLMLQAGLMQPGDTLGLVEAPQSL
jgi:hypothetical protein